MIAFTSLYKKVDDLVDANDFEPALTLLCDTAHRILEGEKLPISKEEIERFLTEADSAMDRAENSQRGAFWSNELDILSEDITMTGLRIIYKYNIHDIKIRISYVRMACTIEKDPERLAALHKEFDELSALYAAQSRRKKLWGAFAR